jgi:precorrin-6B methylase 2
MLEDRVRTSNFIDAIRRTVRPGDVVADLGTGSGVLSVAAAQAGARRVYAIEMRPIADVAARFFQQSGLGDRITLIRGVSTEISLPERADVLVSEMIGNEPLAERILENTWDALQRLLKPGARLIPSALRIYATPMVVPENVRQKTLFTKAALNRWQRWYGLPFRALIDDMKDIGGTHIRLAPAFVDPWKARRWTPLGQPALLHAFDLTNESLPPIGSRVPLCLQREGCLGGFLVHFEADLAEGLCLGTWPTRVERRNHWRSPLWLLPTVHKVHAGMKLSACSGFKNWYSSFEIRINKS